MVVTPTTKNKISRFYIITTAIIKNNMKNIFQTKFQRNIDARHNFKIFLLILQFNVFPLLKETGSPKNFNLHNI